MLLWALNFGLMKNAMKRRIMDRIVMAGRLSMPARACWIGDSTSSKQRRSTLNLGRFTKFCHTPQRMPITQGIANSWWLACAWYSARVLIHEVLVGWCNSARGCWAHDPTTRETFPGTDFPNCPPHALGENNICPVAKNVVERLGGEEIVKLLLRQAMDVS